MSKIVKHIEAGDKEYSMLLEGVRYSQQGKLSSLRDQMKGQAVNIHENIHKCLKHLVELQVQKSDCKLPEVEQVLPAGIGLSNKPLTLM